MAMASNPELRNMLAVDLPQVLEIERVVQINPWSRLSFEESLVREHRVRVLVIQEQLVGYHIACPVADELHILNLAIAKSLQGQGYAHLIMRDILAIAASEKKSKLFLEVRASNTTAQSLYKQWQFSVIDTRKAYYRSPGKRREDALVMFRAV